VWPSIPWGGHNEDRNGGGDQGGSDPPRGLHRRVSSDFKKRFDPQERIGSPGRGHSGGFDATGVGEGIGFHPGEWNTPKD
jgi:hypothetical protein